MFSKTKFFLLVLIGFIFSACNNSNHIDSNETLTLKVGTAPNYKPFNYKENAQLTGFDTDLVNEIAKKEGIHITWIEMSFDGLIPALKTGKIDMIASAMSATDERRQSVDFSKPYYMSKNLYIKLKNNNTLNTKSDLEGKKIGVQLGTIQENAAKAIKNAIIESNEDLNVAVLALKNNKIDAIVADQDTAKGYLAENPELIGFFEETDGGEGFSFAFDKDKQKEALEKFNQGIDAIKTDGTYEKLLKKYDL